MINRSGCLEFKEQNHVGIITLTGHPANTLLDPDFADPEVVAEWIERHEVKGFILRGEGKHFSAGANMERLREYDHSGKKFTDAFKVGRKVLSLIENVEKPVIAAIDGVCLGGGLEIALACHIRYCSSKAVFGFTEITHGIIPALGGIERMVSIAGRSKTLEMLLRGDVFDAQYALKIGIVNRIVDDKSSFNFAMETLRNILDKGEKPVAYAIKAVNNSHTLDVDKAMEEESRMFAELVINRFEGEEKAYE